LQIPEALDATHPESWWQSFFQEHLTTILQGYTGCFPKVNISAGRTKFPDFLLGTTMGYLDILEIKKPSTPLLRRGTAGKNYYWSKELSAAISQVQHYLAAIQEHSFRISAYLREAYQQDLRIVRPKGLLIAGDSRRFSCAEEKDGFRLLSQSIGDIRFITYDELLYSFI